MLENLSNIIVLLASAIGAVGATLLGGLAIWAFRDIRSRSRDILVQILATVLVAVVPIAGILVYLMLRPRETLQEQYVRALEEESLLTSIDSQEFCPSCARRVEGDMRFCPGCHSKLRNECGSCGRAVHLSWEQCPYCGGGLQAEMPQVKRVQPRPQQVNAPAVPALRPRVAPIASQRQPEPEQDANETMIEAPRAQADSISARFTAVLEKVGGALEGAMNKRK